MVNNTNGESPSRPRRSEHLSSLVGRLLLVMVAVGMVACIQFYSFHTSSAAAPTREKEVWKIHQEMVENSMNQWEEKYNSKEKEVEALKEELSSMQDKYEQLKVAFVDSARINTERREKEKQEQLVEKKPEKADIVEDETRARDRVAKKRENVEEKPKEQEQDKLNILLLYADDWRHDTFGAAGNDAIETPVFDKLADEGIMFSHNCVTTAICGISRATLQTGQYFSRHMYNPHQRGDHSLPQFLDYWNETLNGLLRNEGYHVGHVGKWHSLGYMNDKFDVFKSYAGFHETRDGSGDHITAMNERDALEFLKKRPTEKPFMLTVSFFATHAVDGDPRQYIPQKNSMSLYTNTTIPIAPTATEEAWNMMPHFFKYQNEARSRWRKRYNGTENYQHTMKNIYRMVTEVDTTSGKILDELQQQGVLDNTLVIFTTDNGNFHAEHGLADKWYPHQESIRVPLVIKDPRMPKDKIGSVMDEFTLNIDLAPTIVSAAGITPPERMQGRDMADLYLDKEAEAWREYFYYEHPELDCSICIPGSEAFVIKDSGKYLKYMYWPAHDYEQLFDLNDDPYEENDLRNKTQYAVELQAMRELFKKTKPLAL